MNISSGIDYMAYMMGGCLARSFRRGATSDDGCNGGPNSRLWVSSKLEKTLVSNIK